MITVIGVLFPHFNTPTNFQNVKACNYAKPHIEKPQNWIILSLLYFNASPPSLNISRLTESSPTGLAAQYGSFWNVVMTC